MEPALKQIYRNEGKHMRVTNVMMTNNMKSNINTNKNHLSDLEQQQSTGKKIQRPSDDPIIAVRALKLRTSVSEITQYYERNIPDARSWMQVTESALSRMDEVYNSINTYCVQGANDPLTAQDRTSIIQNLEELCAQIYQEGNSDYAGRYVFTGFKTDTSLTFDNDSINLKYTMTEHLASTDIGLYTYVEGSYGLDAYDPTAPDQNVFAEAPTKKECYRMQLSYTDLLNEDVSDLIVTVNGEDGEPEVTSYSMVPMLSTDENAYAPEGGDVYFLYDTGEIILGPDVYNEVRLADDFSVTYQKSQFSKGDTRPQHYFDCTSVELDEEGEEIEDSVIEYDLSRYGDAGQTIDYEVSFSQNLQVNVLAKDCIGNNMSRCVDDIVNAVNDVTTTEEKIAEANKMLEEDGISEDQINALKKMIEQLETEKVLKTKIMQERFSDGITVSSIWEDIVNKATADLGSREVRLNLTESRMQDQQVTFTDLMSTNEDADLADTIINLGSANNVYQASLNAASKVVKNSLMNFI